MILERIDRSGHILDSYSFDSSFITLGRAYDNDLIVRDMHVDGTQVNIQYDLSNDTYCISDLDSTNGFRLHGRKSKKIISGASVTVASGDCFSVGKTRFRILSHSHPIPATHLISWFDTVNSALGHWRALLLLSALVLGLDVFLVYLDKPYAENLLKETVGTIYVLVSAISYGLVWVFIARAQRLEGHFISHINLVLVAVFIVGFFDVLDPVVAFNAADIIYTIYDFGLVLLVCIFFVIYSSCYQSTGLRPVRRVLFSLAIPALLLIGVGIDKLNKSEFNSQPEYDMVLVSESFQWRSTQSTKDFLEQTKELYQPASEEAIERYQQ